MTTTSSALAAAITANAVQLAPAGLAGALASDALTSAMAGKGVAFTMLELMTAPKLQAGMLVAVLALGISLLFCVQHGLRATLLRENSDLRRRLAQLERGSGTRAEPAIELEEWQRLRSAQAEVLRLRGELGLLLRRQHVPWFPTNQVAKTGDKPAPTNYISGFQRLQARGRAQLAEGQTLAIGGWPAHPGYRLLFLAIPRISDENPDQVALDVWSIEAGEKLLGRCGLTGLLATTGVQGTQAVISEDQKTRFLKTINDSVAQRVRGEEPNGDDLGSFSCDWPPEVTSNGVPKSVWSTFLSYHDSWIGVENPENHALNEPWLAERPVSSEKYDLGPYLGAPIVLTPSIMSDNRSIDLTMQAMMFWYPTNKP